MQVSFTGIDLKTKVNDFKQKRDERIIKNLQTEYDRKKCIGSFFGLGSALASTVLSPLISKQIYNKTNINIHPLSMNARVGAAILGAGILGGCIFNKIDEKKNTKFGDFLYNFYNNPRALKKRDEKVDINA